MDESIECDACTLEVRVASCSLLRGDLLCAACAACALARAMRLARLS
jgi:hypothetical protein